jgi:transcriptional regulator of acetoin/glycerol metabolism
MVIAEQENTYQKHPAGGQGPNSTREELARILAGETEGLSAREEIIDSWRESVSLGLLPRHFDLPCDSSLDPDSDLIRAAMPVVDRLGSDLATTAMSVVLADEGCRVVARRAAGPLEEARLDELGVSPGFLWGIEHAGTNGLSTALTTGEPMLVHGDEHYADALVGVATAGAPIHDPRTARVLGVLALVCSSEDANQLLLPMLGRAVREIEQRLLLDTSRFDQLVRAEFLRARRRTRSPLACVSATTLLTNAAAARRMRSEDQSVLWNYVVGNVPGPGIVKTQLTLSDGSPVNVSLEAIVDEQEVVGALIRFAAPSHEAPPSRWSDASKTLRPTFGWDSLTEAEHAVTEQVAKGRTNREVAARLFLSPHTVDSHLRHIYRKLDINSRVDLVRIATTRSVAQSTLVGAADVA